MAKHHAKNKTQADRDREILLNAPELCIWMVAFGCLNILEEVRQDYANRKIDHSVFCPFFNNAFAEFIDTADATSRFGVVLPVIVEANFRARARRDPLTVIEARFSSYFWRWYNWWDDYRLTLSLVDKERMRQLGMDRSPELESYRPAGDWMIYRSEPHPAVVFSAPPDAVKAE